MFAQYSKRRIRQLATLAATILLLVITWYGTASYANASRPAFGGIEQWNGKKPDVSKIPNVHTIYIGPNESVTQTEQTEDGGKIVVDASNTDDNGTTGDQTSNNP